jgi:ornithine cyclodeaminase/alanine dehydrogenase-like protein (mu-crystallin family)
MTLLLDNPQVDRLLAMGDCMAILEEAYLELAHGRGVTRTRSDCLTPATGDIPATYGLKSMDGVVPKLGVGAVRINSDIVTWPVRGGTQRREKIPAAGGRWVGLVLLFSTANGEPLAIMPDGVMQRMRVGAANGLGMKYMARADATDVAILGSGWQAGSQLMAACEARPVSRIRCYSPNPDNRTRFAREMTAQLGREVEACATAEAAVDGADVVLCATSAVESVFHEDWVRPGMHLSSIKPAEIALPALRNAHRVTVHTKDTAPIHVTASDLPRAKGWEVDGDYDFGAAPTLPDMIAGRYQGRTSDAEVTVFVNNLGMGFQFAALGALVVREAKKHGVGRDLPTEWFTEDVHP